VGWVRRLLNAVPPHNVALEGEAPHAPVLAQQALQRVGCLVAVRFARRRLGRARCQYGGGGWERGRARRLSRIVHSMVVMCGSNAAIAAAAAAFSLAAVSSAKGGVDQRSERRVER
jgi:hypothetical protein